MHPYAQYHSNGTLWRAGRSILGLCAAWNHATSPSRMMSDSEHKRSSTYARAIMNRIRRQGFAYGKDYRELSNGSLWPLSR